LIIGRWERDVIAGLCRRAEWAPISLAETRRQIVRAGADNWVASPPELTITLPIGRRAALTIEETAGGGRDRHLRVWVALRGGEIVIAEAVALLPLFGFRARCLAEFEHPPWWDRLGANWRAINFLEACEIEACETWRPIGAVARRVVAELAASEPVDRDDAADEYFFDDTAPDDDA
jgi:hypothetical protein